MPLEPRGGAIVYAKQHGELYLALVHDIFGHWTLSKGRIEEDEDVEQATVREIKEEMNLEKNGPARADASRAPWRGDSLRQTAWRVVLGARARHFWALDPFQRPYRGRRRCRASHGARDKRGDESRHNNQAQSWRERVYRFRPRGGQKAQASDVLFGRVAFFRKHA